ncbi:MAG: tetratricopeptide repeat protein [Desulfobacteraceae bacterium]|nr:tetratricopeptide repeat protein [Desulfobacteraceae bacterium]
MKPADSARAVRITVAVLVSLGLCACSTTKGVQKSVSNLFAQDGYEKLIERQQASIPQELNPPKAAKMTEADYEALGDRYFDQGKLELAFLQYSRVIEKKPENANVRYKRGLIYLKKGMNDSAMGEFRAVLEKDPANALAYQGMGQALYKAKNYQEAGDRFEQAVKSDPGLWISHTYLGILSDYRRQPEKAVEHYQAAMAVKPNEPMLYNNLGISYSLMGNYDKAVEYFSRELQMNPKDARAGNNLGMVLCKLGRQHEAIEAFRIGGDEAQAFNNLGCFYLHEGNYPQAMSAFERALELRSGYYARANENLKKVEAVLQARTDSRTREDRKPPAQSIGKVLQRKSPHGDIRETTLPPQAQETPAAD